MKEKLMPKSDEFTRALRAWSDVFSVYLERDVKVFFDLFDDMETVANHNPRLCSSLPENAASCFLNTLGPKRVAKQLAQRLESAGWVFDPPGSRKLETDIASALDSDELGFLEGAEHTRDIIETLTEMGWAWFPPTADVLGLLEYARGRERETTEGDNA